MPFEVLTRSTSKPKTPPSKVSVSTGKAPKTDRLKLTVSIGSDVVRRLGLQQGDEVEIAIGTEADKGMYRFRFTGGTNRILAPRPVRFLRSGSVTIGAGLVDEEHSGEVFYEVRGKRNDSTGPVLVIDLRK